VSPLPPPPSECRPRVTQLGAFIFLEHASPAARERDRFALKSHPSNSTRLRSQCPSKYFKNNFKNNTGQLDLKLLVSIQQTASQAVSPLPPPPSECRPRVPSSGPFLLLLPPTGLYPISGLLSRTRCVWRLDVLKPVEEFRGRRDPFRWTAHAPPYPAVRERLTRRGARRRNSPALGFADPKTAPPPLTEEP